MKHLISVIVAIAIALLVCIPSATAADVNDGAKVFANNCAACHMGGGNVINGAKTLKKSDLEKYDMASLDAIKYQVTNGKMAMPAFRGRLSDSQIENVAAYVLDQAETGW
ncbi:MAG: cytochrome c6 PetJ [Elainellaceae cyanobacterium]